MQSICFKNIEFGLKLKLNECTLINCDFNKAILRNYSDFNLIKDCKFQECSFLNGLLKLYFDIRNLNRFILEGCTFITCNFQGFGRGIKRQQNSAYNGFDRIKLERVQFINCNLSIGNFIDTHFLNCELLNCDFALRNGRDGYTFFSPKTKFDNTSIKGCDFFVFKVLDNMIKIKTE